MTYFRTNDLSYIRPWKTISNPRP